MPGYPASLHGGYSDGAVVMVDDYALRTELRVPIPTPLSVFVDPPEDPLSPTFWTEIYVWDGTVNEGGQYRFRHHRSDRVL